MSLDTASQPSRPRARRATSTARFGSSRRESHDASAFYDRFVSPELSPDDDVALPSAFDVIYHGDARSMSALEASSVALVVTSPPYFAGKEYEESLGHNGVPGSYFEYLALLRDVLSECKRVLEPGGRIAVNVANLGRRPYRSLAGDVTSILQELGLLLRGEVVWWKGRAAGGSCAWGTFQHPSNPVLRDVTERIVIASKGRFDRALRPEERRRRGLPSTATIGRDEFLEATTDLWELPPESARRVNHPAPFPVGLPARLIDLYTYEGDIVLDPFMGSGTTAVAALGRGRHFVGFDTDATYCDQARQRVADERRRLDREGGARPAVRLPAGRPDHDGREGFASGLIEGRLARELAETLLGEVGFLDVRRDVKVAGAGLELHFTARDRTGGRWAFDLSGAFTATRGGLRRAELLWRALGRAAVLHASDPDAALVLLTTDVPSRNSAGRLALDALRGPSGAVFDVVELLNDADRERLCRYAEAGRDPR